MALQTSTSTESSQAPSSTNSEPPPPQNFFGNEGPSPIIPAFVLTGVLLAVLVMICAWRRLLSARSQAGMVARYGPFGITFVPAGSDRDTMGGPGGFGGVGGGGRRDREVVLGPEPKLWDAYTRRAGDKGWREKEEMTWSGMKPLSLSVSSNARELGNVPPTRQSPPQIPSRQPFLMRKVFQAKSTKSQDDTPEPSEPDKPLTCNILVSVLINMPSPTRPRPRRFSYDSFSAGSSPEKEKEKAHAEVYEDVTPDYDDVDDFNYSLGVASVPFTIPDGKGKG